MISKMYSIRDTVSCLYHQPFCYNSDGQAVRAFKDALTGGTSYSLHPHDYQLCLIGEFDDDTGTLTPFPVVVIFSGSSVGIYHKPCPGDKNEEEE